MCRLNWSRAFQDWLGTVWDAINQDDRLRIANAINAISHQLTHYPLGNSESRSGKRRIAMERPLAVIFSIDFETDVVTVLSGSYVG